MLPKRQIVFKAPDELVEQMNNFAESKGLAVSAAVRMLLMERLQEIAPVTACKQETGAASPTA